MLKWLNIRMADVSSCLEWREFDKPVRICPDRVRDIPATKLASTPTPVRLHVDRVAATTVTAQEQRSVRFSILHALDAPTEFCLAPVLEIGYPHISRSQTPARNRVITRLNGVIPLFPYPIIKSCLSAIRAHLVNPW